MTTTKTAYILLGSNISPQSNIRKAVTLLRQYFDILSISAVYESKPIRKTDADNYLNAVVAVSTNMDPLAIKYDVLRKIEAKLGRQRTEDKYAPRTIDLDLIMLDQLIYRNPDKGLILPDPEITQYAHVVLPLADIASDLIHPELGQTIGQIGQKFLKKEGIRRIDLSIG